MPMTSSRYSQTYSNQHILQIRDQATDFTVYKSQVFLPSPNLQLQPAPELNSLSHDALNETSSLLLFWNVTWQQLHLNQSMQEYDEEWLGRANFTCDSSRASAQAYYLGEHRRLACMFPLTGFPLVGTNLSQRISLVLNSNLSYGNLSRQILDTGSLSESKH